MGITGLSSDTTLTPESPPTLSWKLTSSENYKRQNAYHILAASSVEKLNEKDADLWNSGIIKSGAKRHISWKGKDLTKGTTVHWKVKVWDETRTKEKEKEGESEWSKPATFTIGKEFKPIAPVRLSTFESSSPELNSLYKKSVATLGERLTASLEKGPSALGTGAQVERSARALLYQYDALPILTNWLQEMDASLIDEKLFPIQPGSTDYASPSSEAAISVHHPVWWMGGNPKHVAARWKKFENHMVAREQNDMAFKGTTWGKTEATIENLPSEFVDLCYLSYTTRLTRELAQPAQEFMNVIRFQDYAARIRKSFERRYLDPKTGNLTLSSQTAHLLALRSAVISPEKQKPIIENFLTNLKKEGPKVGPIGAHFLPSVLTLTGNQDLAIKTLTSLKPEQKAAFLGNGISAWMMSYLAGIRSDGPGYQQILIAPRIPSGDTLKWVKASYNSPSGTIVSHWEKLPENQTKVTVSIPAGVFALISLPTTKEQIVVCDNKTVNKENDFAVREKTDSILNFTIQSGTHTFLIK